MSNPYLAELRIMSFNFAPKGWALCNGQTLSIQQNAALFSLIGTYYGGNGVNTFQLPDLRGRVPIHMGPGFTIGQAGGEENHTLITIEMPQHNHLMQVTATTAGAAIPSTNNYLAQGKSSSSGNPAVNLYSTSTTPNTAFAPTAISNNGSGQPHPNQQPYLALTVCIALVGIFPSRN
jgi:microcystin-dependent protein